jgi:carboxypeptidase PM20D1
MKRIFLVLGVGLLGLLAVLLVRTLTFSSVQLQVPAAAPVAIDTSVVAAHLSAAVRVATVSDPAAVDPATFASFKALLAELYPTVHGKLTKEEIGGATLFSWPGSDAALPPALLLAHQDVVPVEPGSEKAWTHAPWSGEIAEGFVWGRGAMDDKASLIAILEAVEMLGKEGFVPKRTVLLGFGHDEEVGGTGAGAIAAALKQRNVKPLFVLDEGMAVIRGIVPGVKRDVALLGVAEKGFLTIELGASTQGGHSSMPPAESAIGKIAKAVSRLETTATPASLDGTAGMFLDAVGPEMGFGLKLVMANRWLLSPVILRIYDGKPSTRATVRTTVAPTMLRAGVKDNVLAREAKAVVNFRIRPGETKDDVLAWVKKTIGDDAVVVTESTTSIASNPSPVTRVESAGYRKVERTLRAVFPEAVVAPGLVLSATDSRQFTELSESVIRFGPMILEQPDLGRLHGVDERVGVANLGEMVRFYRQLIVDSDAP